MVVIEPEPPSEEQNKSVNVSSKPKTKSKSEPSSSTTTKFESRDDDDTSAAAVAAGYASDGFEIASETEFNDGDDGHEHQQQSVPPKGDSCEDSINDEESKQKKLAEANDAKLEGNKLFGDGHFVVALSKYEFALQVVPDMPSSVELRSICYANRGTCFVKLGRNEDAIRECTKALELNPKYVKALFSRGEAHEKLEHFEEAIADMKKILEVEGSNVQAERIIRRLEPLVNAKRERMKEEMIGKLKEMGNSLLGKFGMSVDNFEAVQDPKTGSYSVSFQR